MSHVKLLIGHPEQDVPTDIRGFGKACGGTLAIVLKPATNRGISALQVRGEPARVWKATKANDAPGKPTITMTDADAVAAVKELRSEATDLAPSTMKGSWTGFVECDADGVPRATLRRKIAAYGTLVLQSTAAGWRWTVERDRRWFADAKQLASKDAAPHLTSALAEAMDAMMGLVRSACGVRDTTRREARDSEYAAQRNAKATAKAATKPPKKPAADPTDKLKPRKAIDKAAETAAAKAAKAAARAATKANKLAARQATLADGKAAKAANREAAAAAKAAAKADRAAAASASRKAARQAAAAAATQTKRVKPVKEPKAPKAAKPAKPAAAASAPAATASAPAGPAKKKKLTQAEKDAALMKAITTAMRGIE